MKKCPDASIVKLHGLSTMNSHGYIATNGDIGGLFLMWLSQSALNK